MGSRLWIALLAVAVAAVLPIQASADDTLASAIAAAKGADFAGPNAPPDLLSETDTPTIGDAAAAMSGHSSVQVNDPNLDHIVFFPNALPQPQRPFEFSVQSETSIASHGDNVVVGFNNSADQPVVLTAANRIAFVHRFLSGVGTSHNGGKTWTETSLPPTPGSPFTFGDPALTVDRHGNFYYASLGATAAGQSDVFVGKSTDGGTTFQPGVIAALDPGADKEWIAAGPDPLNDSRDNVYVTWTSFQAGASTLNLARSTDGGQTFTTSTIFAPVNTPAVSSFIQFSNPVVDRDTGRLYVPFLNFGQGSQDFIRVLASDDGGLTFHLLNFNVPGAPDTAAFPNVTPGTLADCKSGGFRTVLHQGADLGTGRLGLPVFQHATRLITQPSLGVSDGKLFIAFNSSTSSVFGDPNSQSQINVLFSPNGGASWQGPFTVAAATANAPQHVHPALAISQSGDSATIGYYVQQADGKLHVESAKARFDTGDGATTLKVEPARQLSPAFDLTPSNNPLPAAGPNVSTNYDRTIVACYNIGEYMGATRAGDGKTLLTWGDNRNSWTSPPQSPAAGTHQQPDVFATRVG
jgi:hypothetical protein